MDLFEALYTTRAMRRVSPDPVPDEVIAAMLDAAVRAPSGGNSQNWRFVVVTDSDVRAELGPLYRRAWDQLRATVYRGRWEQAQERGDESALRVMRSSQWLADNFETVPMWLMAFHRNDTTGASIFPAVWSAMLAARAHGVGTCLTTILALFEQESVCDILGVPTDRGWQLAAAVSCGYPLGRWGLAQRESAEKVAFQDGWGRPLPFASANPAWRP